MRYPRNDEGFNLHMSNTVASCGTKFLILSNKVSLTPEYMVVPSGCKSNYCERCRKQNLRILRHRLLSGMKHHSWRLVTLTFEQAGKTPEQLLRSLRATFNRFSKRLKRKYPKVIFIRTIEIHQTGFPHIHLVIDRYIPAAWIQKNWKDVGGGITDIRARKVTPNGTKKFTHKDAACYLTEEIEKQSQDPHRLGAVFWKSGLRTVGTSRNFKLRDRFTPWEFYRMSRDRNTAEEIYQDLLFRARLSDSPTPGFSRRRDVTFVGAGFKSQSE